MRLGTRGSKLAMAQAHSVSALLRAANPGLEVEIVPIKTSGDRGQREVLGAFVREIQDAILRGEVDGGLHCLKDLPVEEVSGLRFSAYLQREDPSDTLISKFGGLQHLPPGAVVGTGSVRRTSQLAAVRPDLQFKPIVGNIDTRLGKLISGEYDAIILAVAGLRRLGLLEDWASGPHASLRVSVLSYEEMLPAPAQAVLVLETRASDGRTHSSANALADESSEIAARAERAVLKGFGGGCSIPVAALGLISGGSLRIQALVASPDGSIVLREESSGQAADWQELASVLVDKLAARGARELFTPRVPTVGGVEH